MTIKLQNMSIVNLKSKLLSFFNRSDTTVELEEKKPNKTFTSTPTIIARDLRIEGNVFSSGLVEIEGTVNGVIKGNAVILLENGVIDGEIVAESFSIRGKFSGTIKAQNVNIADKAQVSGTIEYSTLSIEDGACVDAKFKKIVS